MNASLNLLAEWATTRAKDDPDTGARPLWASIAAEVTAYLDDKDAPPPDQTPLFDEPTTTATESDWFGPEALAKELGVPTRTVYGWRTKGGGPRGYRIGRHVRFKREDVDAWLETRADKLTT